MMPEPGHHLEQVIGDVDFPPVEALARRARVVVVIVVPALAERDQREEPVVAARVAGLVALLAEHVRQRVDGVRAVRAQHRRHEEAPDQHLPAVGVQARRPLLQRHAEEEHADGEQHRHDDVEAVEPAQLGEVHEIAHALQVRRETFLRQEPAHVGAHEAVLDGRVRVLRLVRILVVIAMMRGPPDGPALHGRGAEHAEQELPDARGLERLVREVAVVEAGDREHADEIQRDAHDHRDRAHADRRTRTDRPRA